MEHDMSPSPLADSAPDLLYKLRRDRDVAAFEHRRQMRHLLAVIRAIVRRTSLTHRSLEDYAAHLEGRIGALGRVQEILMRGAGSGADLMEVLSGEFLAEAIPDERVEMAGPRVFLAGKVAASLALAIHELTTNALKFGALSAPHGRIAIGWTMDARDPERVRFAWTERGVPIASAAPRATGFGAELIERTLPYEIGARTALDFAPGGLHCLIEFRCGTSDRDERDVHEPAPGSGS